MIYVGHQDSSTQNQQVKIPDGVPLEGLGKVGREDSPKKLRGRAQRTQRNSCQKNKLLYHSMLRFSLTCKKRNSINLQGSTLHCLNGLTIWGCSCAQDVNTRPTARVSEVRPPLGFLSEQGLWPLRERDSQRGLPSGRPGLLTTPRETTQCRQQADRSPGRASTGWRRASAVSL